MPADDRDGRDTPGSSGSQQRSQGARRPQYGDGNGNSSFSQSTSKNIANEVIVPNKSKLVEEDVGGMPHSSSAQTITGDTSMTGNESFRSGRSGHARGQSSGSNAGSNLAPSDRRLDRMRGRDAQEREPVSPLTPTSVDGPGQSYTRLGKNATSPGAQQASQPTSPDWNNPSALSRASETSSIGTRLIGNYAASASSQGRNLGDWKEDDIEKLRSDYEYRIATMQNRMQSLERDLEAAQQSARVSGVRDAV